MYAIHATIVHHTNDSHCVSVDHTKQIPTFYISAQGVRDEAHAAEIARSIICPVELEYESITVYATATRMPASTGVSR